MLRDAEGVRGGGSFIDACSPSTRQPPGAPTPGTVPTSHTSDTGCRLPEAVTACLSVEPMAEMGKSTAEGQAQSFEARKGCR